MYLSVHTFVTEGAYIVTEGAHIVTESGHITTEGDHQNFLSEFNYKGSLSFIAPI